MSKGNRPEPYPCIGRRAKDLLTKGYSFDHKFTLSIPNYTGTGLTISGSKRDRFFIGDICALYKSGNTTVEVKVDTHSNVSSKVSLDNIFSHTKTIVSFRIPDHKSGKMDVEYCDEHAAINSSIGLNPSPLLEVQAVIGTKGLSVGGEIGFDTGSGLLVKYNAGVSFNSPGFSAAVILEEKGQAVRASYYHAVCPDARTAVAAEMVHRVSSYENSFAVGSQHVVDGRNVVKARFWDNGKVGMQWEREWRPRSRVTFSAEVDTKSVHSAPKLGLAVALVP